MDIYVIRHGQTESNVKGILNGKGDEGLTPEGIRQAEKIKQELNDVKIDLVYCSPLERAKQTAMIIAPDRDIIYDERISERNPGTFLGKPIGSTIDSKDWNSTKVERTEEGAETLLAGMERCASLLKELFDNHRDKTILIITHSYISKCIWMILSGEKDQKKIENFYHNNTEIIHYYDENITIQ